MNGSQRYSAGMRGISDSYHESIAYAKPDDVCFAGHERNGGALGPLKIVPLA